VAALLLLGYFSLGIVLVFLIFLIMTWVFIYIVNIPIRRRFGHSAFRLLSGFIDHWLYRTYELEGLMAENGETVNADFPVFGFRAKKGIKGLFVVPPLHPGPFGELGGSNLPEVVSKSLENEFGGMAFVFHSASLPAQNPVLHEQVEKIWEKLKEPVRKMKYALKVSEFVSAEKNGIAVSAQVLSNGILLSSTLSPKPTEDMEPRISRDIEEYLGRGTVLADAHNCYGPDSGRVFYEDVIKDIKVAAGEASKIARGRLVKRLNFGSASVKLGYGRYDGMGDGGVKIAVLDTGKKTAYVLFDANNLVRGLREEIIEVVKNSGIDEAEVYTTDTHTVNIVRGASNPLGKKIPHRAILEAVMEGIKKALKEMEDVRVGFTRVNIPGIRIFGEKQESELAKAILSTIRTAKLSLGFYVLGFLLSLIAIKI